ncbi:tRNA uridine-5-carboxymethylaminomethyl(34) synthesis GTPase MnmE [candidate division KSB3 bacterium]|uniref:tRNA modification GTPase MnmE n=1 Tax=candidate division KSB3 bacterium TaxID=2044937 RepID=A0A2G6K8Z7_9BACT|nr:MAG: tRNA uridine-5-carboxymethylaminomethyl(34) synthesis GTPase MnmE [candidate division KSB3 bacterium]
MYLAQDEDTIAAISTPPGEGGIGIVRISGKDALNIAQTLFVGSRRQDLRSVPGYSLHHGLLLDPDSHSVLDECLVSVMRAPHSYTREDVIEVNCHGGRLSVRHVLEAVLRCGARLATAGEFTKRAFLNGRLDLAQAESVIDIIQAKTDAGLQLAVQQLHGKLSTRVELLRQTLQQLLALVEASIDFSDEDIELISHDRISSELQSALAAITELLAGAQEGKIVRDGLSIAIVGKPNVGKSSLLNVFLEEERAIVTPVPGTTRDTIEDYINLHGVPIRLIDTAGIRKTDDHVERLGVERSRRLIEQADMILCLFDTSVPWTEEDDAFLDMIRKKAKILVLNKIDLPAQVSVHDVLSHFSETVPVFQISISEQLGLDELKQEIVDEVLDMPLESVAVTNVRHKQALTQTQKSLTHAENSTSAGMSQEFIALDLRDALQHLGEITGETTTEDILDRIFSTFCIGK